MACRVCLLSRHRPKWLCIDRNDSVLPQMAVYCSKWLCIARNGCVLLEMTVY